jgi:hypothetical protein
MKLLALIIAAILMSVFSENIYADSEKLEIPSMTVEGYIDPELLVLRKQETESNAIDQATDEKLQIVENLIVTAPVIVKKQVEIFSKRQKLNDFYLARDKYLFCLEKKNRDCSDLKATLDSMNLNATNTSSAESKETYITNRPQLEGIKKCLRVAREEVPEFKARIKLLIQIDKAGYPTSVQVDEQESMMYPHLSNFPRCISHFANDLNFHNPFEENAEISQVFTF